MVKVDMTATVWKRGDEGKRGKNKTKTDVDFDFEPPGSVWDEGLWVKEVQK